MPFIAMDFEHNNNILSPYLPYSDKDSIICEATLANFNPTASTWGEGTNPIQLVGTPTLDSTEMGVYMPSQTDNVYGYVDLGSPNTPFTAYLVAKVKNIGNVGRVMCAMTQRSTSQGIQMIGTPLKFSSWNSDTEFSPSIITSTINNYVICAMKFTNVGTNGGTGFANTSQKILKSPTACGQYLTLFRTDPDSSTTNKEPRDGYAKYLGVVNKAEDDLTIISNMQNLSRKLHVPII